MHKSSKGIVLTSYAPKPKGVNENWVRSRIIFIKRPDKSWTFARVPSHVKLMRAKDWNGWLFVNDAILDFSEQQVKDPPAWTKMPHVINGKCHKAQRKKKSETNHASCMFYAVVSMGRTRQNIKGSHFLIFPWSPTQLKDARAVWKKHGIMSEKADKIWVKISYCWSWS